MEIRRVLTSMLFTFTLALAGCDGGYDPPPEAEPMDSIAPMPKTPPVPGTDDPNE